MMTTVSATRGDRARGRASGRPMGRPARVSRWRQPQAQLALLLLLASGGLVYGYVTRVWQPAQPALEALDTRRGALDQANAAVRGSIASYGLPRLKARIAAFQSMRGTLNQLIPPSDSLLDVLGVLHHAAQQAGVDVTGIRPDSSALSGPYAQRGWAVQAAGSYTRLGYFLTLLGNQPHIMRPAHVTLTPGTKTDLTSTGAAEVRNIVRMSLTLETVWNATPLDSAAPAGGYGSTYAGSLMGISPNSLPAGSVAGGPLPAGPLAGLPGESAVPSSQSGLDGPGSVAFPRASGARPLGGYSSANGAGAAPGPPPTPPVMPPDSVQHPS